MGLTRATGSGLDSARATGVESVNGNRTAWVTEMAETSGPNQALGAKEAPKAPGHQRSADVRTGASQSSFSSESSTVSVSEAPAISSDVV